MESNSQITNKEMADVIMDDLSRGVKMLKSRGIYKNIDREVIIAVVQLKELGTLIEKVKEIDPDAFIIVNNVHEVLGHGFRRRI